MKAAVQVRMETVAYAAALAAKYARVDVVPGYPITPQTSIMEAVAAMVENGELHARFIPVEGEHSVLAAAVAASAAGARVFTATSANGLLYMHEVLHMASGGRLPVVMCNVNRGIFAPWTLWADHQDSSPSATPAGSNTIALPIRRFSILFCRPTAWPNRSISR